MKQFNFFLFLLFIVTACEKEELDNPVAEQRSKLDQILDHAVLPDQLNEEGIRIINDLTHVDYEVAIYDNPNYGHASVDANSAVFLGGRFPNKDYSVEINGQEFSTSETGGMSFVRDEFKALFGTEIDVKIMYKGEEIAAESNLYIPHVSLVTKLSQEGSIDIERTGNTLSWNTDQNSPSNMLALNYHTSSSSGAPIDSDVILIENNGSFNLDPLLTNPDVASIYFSLTNGNTLSVVHKGKKILFDISSFDHHEYTILR